MKGLFVLSSPSFSMFFFSIWNDEDKKKDQSRFILFLDSSLLPGTQGTLECSNKLGLKTIFKFCITKGWRPIPRMHIYLSLESLDKIRSKMLNIKEHLIQQKEDLKLQKQESDDQKQKESRGNKDQLGKRFV